MTTQRLAASRRVGAAQPSPGHRRWRVLIVLAMITLVVVLAGLRAEGFSTEARLLHVAGWALLALLGLSDGARRFRGSISALGSGRGGLERCLGLLQAGTCIAMLLGFVPFPG